MTALLAPPIRPQKLTKWKFMKCNCNRHCRGHIVLRDANNVLQVQSQIEEPIPQETLFVIGVDIKAWNSMRTKERKKPYTPKSKTKKKTKIFGKLS